MRIKTKTHVNARTLDGRVYSASEGAVTEIDDDDDGMVGLAKSLIASGQAEHADDAGTVEEPSDEGEQTPEQSDEDKAAAELEQLRAEAEAAGVKVDGRWGADRLREEIAAYQAQPAGETE